MELIFFDVDGTLSAPKYLVDGEFRIGMTDAKWLIYCEQNGEDTYQYCEPVPMVKRYAQKRKKDGARLFVLTTCQGEDEFRGKEKFVAQHYPGIFEKVISVEHDAEKINMIKDLAKKQGIALPACELVDDTYSILLAACVSGIKATHVANIAAQEPCR